MHDSTHEVGPCPAVEALVLKHFSLKCDPKRVRELVASRIPPEWRDRVYIFYPPA